MRCTQCGAEGSGRFCGSCGAPLKPVPCPGCREEVPPGTRFCNACGTPVRGHSSEPKQPVTRRKAEESGGRGFGPRAGWWLAGGLGLVILTVVGFLAFSDAGSDPPAPPSATGPAPQVDLGSMTPREAADRLFNRVMQALADRDTAEAVGFLPMAIQAYEMARPLDEVGLFQLALLQRSAGDPDAARTTALEALNQNPDHLLNLWAAAETARAVGDPWAAEVHYRHLLDVWDSELAEQRPEYEEHGTFMPLIREDAERFLFGAAS